MPLTQLISIFVILGCLSARGQNATATLVSYKATITECGDNSPKTTDTVAPIPFNESPFPCELNSEIASVAGQVIPNLPGSISGTMQPGSNYFEAGSGTTISIDLQADLTTGSSGAKATHVQTYLTFGNNGGQFFGSDSRNSLPPNATTHVETISTASNPSVNANVESDSTFTVRSMATLETQISPGTYGGFNIEISAQYQVRSSGGGGGPFSVSSLDQKIGAAGSTIRLNIHGQGFAQGATVQLLPDGSDTPDPRLAVSDINVVSATEIQATLTIADIADAGLKTLSVTSGGSTGKLSGAFYVETFTILVSQGGPLAGPTTRVANHPTVVRAGPFHGAAGPNLPDHMSGAIYVFQGDTQIPGSPFLPNKPLLSGANSDVLTLKEAGDKDRFFLRDTVNCYFGLPSTLPSYDAFSDGSYRFAFAFSTTDPGNPPPRLPDLSRSDLQAYHDQCIIFADNDQKFVTTRPFKVFVGIDPRLSTNHANALFNNHLRDLEYLGAAYPVDNSRSNLILRRVELTTLDIDGLKPPPERQRHYADNVLDRLADILANINAGRPTEQQFDKIVLILESGDFGVITAPEEYAGIGQIRGTAGMLGTTKDSTFAHELGHTLGLYDTYAGPPPPRRPPNPRLPGAAPDGNLVETGTERLAPLNAFGNSYLAVAAGVLNANGEPLPDIPYVFRSMMGSAQIRWPDSLEWKYLYQYFVGSGGAARKGATTSLRADSIDLVNVHGFIDVNDSVDVTGIRHAPLPPTTVDPGDYSLELLDGNSQTVSARSFAVEFVVPEEGLVTETSFNVSVPYVAGAAMVRIRKAGNVLFSHPISATPPSVQVVSPAGGETLSGPFTISWNASDPDGDALTYSIVYLRDDGTPMPVADHLADTSFQWQNPSASGGSNNGQIVVTANDGVNEGRGTSAPFSVSKSSPVVTIISPPDGSAFPAGSEVVLSGAGSDAEDGYLPATSLSFSSSIDGNLGSGGTVSVQLSPGTHTITLSGTDSDGLTSQASITVTVGDAATVPLFSSLSSLTGATGSSVTLNGSNFGSNVMVNFGGVAATITSAGASQIVVTVPSGLSPGEVPVSITSGGFTASAGTFTVAYGHPHPTSVRPDNGAPGTPVYIAGSEFASPAGSNTVQFGNATATVLRGGPEGLLVTVPAIDPGPTNVVVMSGGVSSDPLPFTVASGDPNTPVVLRSANPSSGSPDTLVTLSGRGFSTIPGANVVSFGNVNVTPVAAASDSLQVTVPYGMPSGDVNVVVSVNSYPSNPIPFSVTAPTPTPGPSIAGCAAVPGNLISWWRAEGDASDVTGTNPGTLQGGATASVAGKVGQAFSFDGSNGYVSIGNPASLKLTSAITIEGWINPSAGPGQGQLAAILTKWAQDFNPDSNSDSYGLWIVNRNGTYKLFSALHQSGTTEPNIEAGSIPLNSWSHVAMTFDAGTGEYDLYLNGAQVLTVNSPGNILATEHGVSIGREESYLGRYFTGLIDELSIYNRALSSSEIQNIYNVGAAGKCYATSGGAAVTELQNISTRLQVGSGDSLAIGGFIIVGTGAKPVLVRAIGPSLANAGVAGALGDPTLDLVNGSGDSLVSDDDWVDSPQQQQIAAALPPKDNSESSAIAALPPGAYTALVRGYNDGTGVGLVEIYDLDQGASARLANISTRGQVGTDANVLIGGFIVGQQGQFVVRAIGPSLGAAGVPGSLGDPILELRDGQGQQLASNDNWRSDQEAALLATGIPPSNDLEAAIVQTLSPGAYTAIVRGKHNTTGVALVEVYNLQ